LSSLLSTRLLDRRHETFGLDRQHRAANRSQDGFGGISARAKLIGQIGVATASVLILRPHLGAVAGGLDLQVPLLEIAIPVCDATSSGALRP